MIAVFGIPAFCSELCRHYSLKMDIKKGVELFFLLPLISCSGSGLPVI